MTERKNKEGDREKEQEQEQEKELWSQREMGTRTSVCFKRFSRPQANNPLWMDGETRLLFPDVPTNALSESERLPHLFALDVLKRSALERINRRSLIALTCARHKPHH